MRLLTIPEYGISDQAVHISLEGLIWLQFIRYLLEPRVLLYM